MKKEIILTLAIFFMVSDVFSDGLAAGRTKYIKIETLSGVEAEVIRVAVDQFNSEELNITPHGYEVLLYMKNDDYLVVFEKAKNAAPGTINPAYEVVISHKTLKVIHSQFVR